MTVILFALALYASAFSLDQLRVVAPMAEIRLHPAYSSPTIIVVTMGTVLENLGKEDSWYQVKFKDIQGLEKIGYIEEKNIELLGPKVEKQETKQPEETPREEKALPKEIVTEEKKPVIPPAHEVKPFRAFSSAHIRLWGGLSSLGSGDIDKDLTSHDLMYKDWADYYQATYFSGSASGGHKASRQAMGGEAGIYSEIFKNISLGLGFEYFAKSGETTQNLTYKWNDNSFHNIDRTISDKMSIMGILLNANYQIPFNIHASFLHKIAIAGEVGLGLYFINDNYEKTWKGKYEYWAYGNYYDSGGIFRQGWYQYIRGNWTQDDLFETSKTLLGFTGGLGIELALLRNISLLLQGKIRILNLESPAGNETFDFSDAWEEAGQNYLGYADQRYWTKYQNDDSWASKGKIYLYDYQSSLLNKAYTFLTCNKNLLESDSSNSNFREAKVDLSGFIFMIGVKILLF